MYYRRDEFTRAEKLYRESLAIREKTLGPENPQTGESLDNLGQALVAQGRYGAAEPYYQRALALFKKAPGSTARLARTLNNLGMLYYDQGDYTRAEPFLERSLALTRRPTRPDQAELERVEGNLESLYADEGDFTKAEPMARRILATREKIYRTPHHEVAYGAAQLASIYRAHKDYKLATTYDAQALATMEKVYPGGHTDIAVFLSHLALDNTLTGDFAAAEPLFARAIEIQRALPSDHPQRIATLANFALMNYKKGNYGRARELYSAALEISEKAHNPGHPDTIALMIDGARTLWQLDQHAESRDLLASANRSVVEFWARNLLRSEDSRRGTLITKFDELLPVTLAIAAASRREDPIGATTLAALAIGARKGVQSAARQEIYATIRHETNPQALELFGKLVETAEQEGRLLHSTAPDAATKLAALRASENEAERRLLDGSGRYRDWLKPVEPSDVAANLAPGTAFIDVLRYRQVDIVTGAPGAMRYAAAIYRNGTPPRLVDLGPASLIDAAVRTLRLNFENIWEVSGGVRKLISGDRFQANLAQTEADCAVLFRRVMTKLLPALESAKDLIIAPDAALAEIPWEIMRDDRGYLIEHGYRVRYIDSARSLVYPAPERDPHSQAAVIAEVDYNGGSAGSVENASMVAFPWATEERPAGGWMAWQPLNGGAEILKTLRELQNSGKIAVIRKLPRGSEEEIAALDRPAAIIAHTHGFFQAARRIGDLPDSGIVLYGANRADRPAVRDGWLTSKEVMLLNLEGTRLVALLGCDTGRGVEAGEGVQGLRHALQVAGTRSTMLTLWQVGDLSAARFLREWLIRSSGHSGNSMEAALADTRLAFLHGDAREPNAARQSNRWRHPYFWAAATLAGTGGALNMAVDAH